MFKLSGGLGGEQVAAGPVWHAVNALLSQKHRSILKIYFAVVRIEERPREGRPCRFPSPTQSLC